MSEADPEESGLGHEVLLEEVVDLAPNLGTIVVDHGVFLLVVSEGLKLCQEL